jgi:hypothetical protein
MAWRGDSETCKADVVEPAAQGCRQSAHRRLVPGYAVALTPRGRLLLTAADGSCQSSARQSPMLAEAFGRRSGHGLLELGAADVGT